MPRRLENLMNPFPTPLRLQAALPALAALLAGGCVTVRAADDGIARGRLGETLRGGPIALVLTELVEDSRCPADVACIQAGTVRVAATVDGAPVVLTLDQTVPVRANTVTLVEVYPAAKAGVRRYPDEYRFGVQFDPAAR